MTALQVIQKIKSLPLRERRKVFKFVYGHEVPNAPTRRALHEDLSKARRFEPAEAMMSELKS
jgi:translation initiation factor IF-2